MWRCGSTGKMRFTAQRPLPQTRHAKLPSRFMRNALSPVARPTVPVMDAVATSVDVTLRFAADLIVLGDRLGDGDGISARAADGEMPAAASPESVPPLSLCPYNSPPPRPLTSCVDTALEGVACNPVPLLWPDLAAVAEI